MPGDDILDNRKTYSRPFKILAVVESFEDLEEMTAIRHVKSDTVVFYIVDTSGTFKE